MYLKNNKAEFEAKYVYILDIVRYLPLIALTFYDIYTFFSLMKNMKKYHNYEYRRTKGTMISQFTLIIISIVEIALVLQTFDVFSNWDTMITPTFCPP